MRTNTLHQNQILTVEPDKAFTIRQLAQFLKKHPEKWFVEFYFGKLILRPRKKK